MNSVNAVGRNGGAQPHKIRNLVVETQAVDKAAVSVANSAARELSYNRTSWRITGWEEFKLKTPHPP